LALWWDLERCANNKLKLPSEVGKEKQLKAQILYICQYIRGVLHFTELVESLWKSSRSQSDFCFIIHTQLKYLTSDSIPTYIYFKWLYFTYHQYDKNIFTFFLLYCLAFHTPS